MILLVEDDDDVRDVAAEALAGAGYSVLAASNGEEALRQLDCDDGNRVALLFTDVVMPGRPDGMTLAQEARRRRPDLKVLVTTAYAEHLHPDELDRLGAQLLRKPYRLAHLRDEVRRLLEA